jgi:hypothetical protein
MPALRQCSNQQAVIPDCLACHCGKQRNRRIQLLVKQLILPLSITPPSSRELDKEKPS